jgi:hypothetical protein
MAIGSFVNGVFQGMQARDTMDNNKRLRKMDDTRFEREGEQHGWRKESHELAMERARKADAKGKGYSRTNVIRDTMQDYGGGEVSGDTGGGRSIMPAIGGTIGGGAPLSFGSAGQPRQMSAMPAAQPQQIAQGPMEFDFIPGQGLIPRGVA